MGVYEHFFSPQNFFQIEQPLPVREITSVEGKFAFAGNVGHKQFFGRRGVFCFQLTLTFLALTTRQELLLPLVGGIFVIEALSVILQVASFKTRGKRIFKMAPIHHHFELKGWPETKVIVRFWIVSLVFAILALATLKLR